MSMCVWINKLVIKTCHKNAKFWELKNTSTHTHSINILFNPKNNYDNYNNNYNNFLMKIEVLESIST